MAFFHQSIPQNDFTSLFRLLDDYDDHRASRSGPGSSERSQISLRTFSPRFDVHEEKDAYHLNGELPGIEQKDIHLDFVDAQTITVRGRVERNYSTSSNNGNEQAQGKGGNTGHKATVEDESEQGGDQQKQVSTTTGAEKKVGKHHPHQGLKFWASERSVGEFTRSFTFPTNVDQDKVKASLKNGILTVVVPKAHAPQAKRIQIE